MKWFHNMKIRMKMLISFFVVIALLAVMAVFTVFEMNAVDQQNSYATEFPAQRQTSILQVQSALREFRRIVTAMAMYAPLNDPARIAPLANSADEAYNSFINSIDSYRNLVLSDPQFTQEDKNMRVAIADDLRNTIAKYNTEIRSAVENSALNGEYENAIDAVISGAELVGGMDETTIELLEAARRSSTEADLAATATAERANMLIIIIAVVVAAVSIVIALYVSSLISKPLIPLASFMEKAGVTGNLTFSEEDVKTIGAYNEIKDEIGQTIAGASLFVKRVSSIAAELETVANGNLTIDIEVLSDSDTLGGALKKMTDNLNIMFGEVNSSTAQVSTGAKQVADGSQSLAQGATEQAASIQQLSASISDIAVTTKANATMADKTSKLSESIKESAEKGNRQMNDMMTAVRDINEASQSISKIIKTIDDIAFQTNILALNAAVEAARAGQHGKGFAVVAEEVRNLAAKSAEAAKETGNMIQNSMDKAEFGSCIAGETATSLSEIVAGINESSQLIEEIARSSEEQAIGISQINTGIDQVAEVVQQNSATAEESAAASEEMSSQSTILQELVSQFKLKETHIEQLRDIDHIEQAIEHYAIHDKYSA